MSEAAKLARNMLVSLSPRGKAGISVIRPDRLQKNSVGIVTHFSTASGFAVVKWSHLKTPMRISADLIQLIAKGPTP